jgi:hypothetical protein
LAFNIPTTQTKISLSLTCLTGKNVPKDAGSFPLYARENKTIRIFVCYYDILLSGLHRSAGVRKRRRGMMMVVKEEEEDGKRPKERRRRKKRNVKLVEDIFFF